MSHPDPAGLVAATLKRLHTQFGADAVLDPARLGSMLRDDCGESKREIAVLVDALTAHVVADLRPPLAVTVPALAQRLATERGTDPALARWAVESWAIALDPSGASEVEIAALRSRPPELERPRSALDRLLETVRGAGPKLWVPLIAAAIGVYLWQGSASQLTAMELAGTRFTGGNEVAEVIGDGRNYTRGYRFKVNEANPPKAVELRWLDGTSFSDGQPRRRLSLAPVDIAKGLLEEPFSYQGIGARKGEVYLVFADDTTSKPIPYAYRAVPVPGTDAPRIKRIDYAKQIPANGQMQPFRVEFEDNDADITKIELIVRQGNWTSGVSPIEFAKGQKTGNFNQEFSTRTPQKGLIEVRLIDARGNYSNTVAVAFEALASTPGPTPTPDPLTISRIQPPPALPASADTKSKVTVFYSGGDVVKLELYTRAAATPVNTFQWPPAAPGKTFASVSFEMATPPRSGVFNYEVIIIDTNGRRSVRHGFDLSVL